MTRVTDEEIDGPTLRLDPVEVRATLSTVVVGLSGLVAASVAASRPADACTPPPEGVHGRTVLPEDGATDVPRNARILVVYDTDSWVLPNALELRAQGGGAVAATTATPTTIGYAQLVIPIEPLAASTTYELLDTLLLPCDSNDPSVCIGEPTVIATFTTGTGLDTTPPVLTGVSVDSSYFCVPSSCLEAETEMLDRISVAGREDDLPVDWIRYEYLSTTGEVLAGPTSWLTAGRGCGGGAGEFQLWTHLSMPIDFQLRAVDVAGNAETTPHAIAGGSCDLVGDRCDPDAGVGDGDGDGGGFSGMGDGGGCGCATGSGSSGSPILTIGVLLLLGRRRGYRATGLRTQSRTSA